MLMKGMSLALAVAVAIATTGCEDLLKDGEWFTDQNARRQIFKECLQLIPKGPERTVYNDWAEVVSECEDAAFMQSREWRPYK